MISHSRMPKAHLRETKFSYWCSYSTCQFYKFICKCRKTNDEYIWYLQWYGKNWQFKLDETCYNVKVDETCCNVPVAQSFHKVNETTHPTFQETEPLTHQTARCRHGGKEPQGPSTWQGVCPHLFCGNSLGCGCPGPAQSQQSSWSCPHWLERYVQPDLGGCTAEEEKVVRSGRKQGYGKSMLGSSCFVMGIVHSTENGEHRHHLKIKVEAKSIWMPQL